MCIPCLPISQLNVFNPHQRKSALKCCEHLPIDQAEVAWCVLYTRCTEHCTLYTCCCLSVTQCARPSADVPRTVEPGRSVASGPKPGKCEEISELACCCWRLPHSENTGGGAVQWCSGAVVQVRHQRNGSGVQCHRAVLPTIAKEVSNKDFFHPISSVLGAP